MNGGRRKTETATATAAVKEQWYPYARESKVLPKPVPVPQFLTASVVQFSKERDIERAAERKVDS